MRSKHVILAAVGLVLALASPSQLRASGTPPMDVELAGGSLWLTSGHDGQVLRVDPRGLGILARIDVGRFPERLAITGGALWVSDPVGRSLWRIDTGTNRVTTRVRLRQMPSDIAAVGNTLVVVGSTRRRKSVITIVDGSSGALRHRIGVDAMPAPALVLGAESSGLVLAAFLLGGADKWERSLLVRLDAAKGRLVRQIRLPGTVTAIAASPRGALVALDGRPGRVVPLDRSLGHDGRARRLGFHPRALALSGAVAWATSECGAPGCDIERASVWMLDARTGRALRPPISVAQAPQAVLADGGDAWVAHWAKDGVGLTHIDGETGRTRYRALALLRAKEARSRPPASRSRQSRGVSAMRDGETTGVRLSVDRDSARLRSGAASDAAFGSATVSRIDVA